jgi:polygalacturonase
MWTVALSAAVLSFGVGAAAAQDTRVVTEPKVPPVCVKLEARLLAAADANGGKVREEDEGKLNTERIQKALDGCGAGKAVELAGRWCPPGAECKAQDENAFLTGPLELRDGVTLLVDKGVTLFASRDPKVFEMAGPGEPAKCGTSEPRPTSFPTFALGAARPKGGCKPLITVNAKNAAVMGEGTIDARGYAQILGKDYSWWQMARRAQPHDDLYYSIRMITANHADGFVLYGIHLNNSGNYHVSVNQTNGFTAWGVHLQTPVNKKLIGTDNDARNTDGIDPGTSENVTVAYSWIDNGDDNIAIKQGVSHMSVVHDHFYSGHGMSIGSETVLGQSFLLVDDLTEDHTASGIRIKSNVKRGGPVHDLIYKGVCMRGVPIPIAISPYYTNQTVEPFEDPKYTGDKIPDYKRITLEDIYSEGPGDVLIAGLDDAHRTEVTLKNVDIHGLTAAQVHVNFADLTVWGMTNRALSYDLLKGHPTVKVTLAQNVLDPGTGGADACAGKFVPYE